MTCLWRSGSHFPTTPGIPQWFNNQSKYAGMMEVAHELSIMKFIHQWWSGYNYFNTACLPVISSSDQHKVPIVVSFLGMINQASGGRLIILNHFCHKKTAFFFFWSRYLLCSQSYGFSSSHVWIRESDLKAEHQRIDAFELWCWRRLLRVPWTARRSIQSILKEIIPEYSLKGLMLKLKLQYFGHLIQRTDSLEKTLRLGKIEGIRRRGRQRMR